MSPDMNPGVAHLIGGAFALAAWLGVLYLALASVLVTRFGRGARRVPSRPPPASILVPLCGEDAGLSERLSALCRQEYGAPVQLVCGVRDPDDAAVGIVEALAAEAANVRIDLKIDPRQHGGNGKVSNLINMSPLAKAEFLAIIDSDILVGESHLSSLAGELERPGVGAVTCLYHGVGATSIWSWLAALGINADFLPNVVAALTLGAARPCFGATIALRRSTLQAIGGFRAVADCLHDDYAIGDRLRNAGYSITIPHFSVEHVCREQSARALLQNQLRAARTIRMINPAGYAGSIIAHPVAFAIPAALLDWAHGAPLLALAFAGRMILCLSVEYAFSLRRQAYWLAPFYDLLFLLVYAASFLGAGIYWRGERYRLKSDGTLVQDPQEDSDANPVSSGPHL
jgi:ceramide glucosyltransferase